MKKGRHLPKQGSHPHAALAGAALSLIAFGAHAADVVKKVSPAPAPAAAPPAPPPAPMGVFGADMPAPGKWGLSVTANFANAAGQRIGNRYVTPEFVATTVPYFFNPAQTLRLVPQNVSLATQTVGIAYGVMKDVAVVVTAGMAERNLEMLTFQGLGRNANRLGRSYTGTTGFGDMTVSGIYRIYQDEIHRIQVNLGMSFPTGSNEQTFTLLQPNGTYATSRAFYALQPGSNTYDIMPGIVYAGFLGQWSWGASYRGRFPLAANPQGYRWGDYHEFNGWGGYTWTPGLTTTFRVAGSTLGHIRGFDNEIRGRAPAANPNFYGGERVELFGGATISGKFIGYENASVAIEAGLPVYQNLNGPQIMKNWQAGMSLRLKI
ncbi:MAG: alpha-amylase [Methylocystis sp.]|nr:MAG: alpha-amylase [Methylocystis sp.]